jgi:hypothetical protein
LTRRYLKLPFGAVALLAALGLATAGSIARAAEPASYLSEFRRGHAVLETRRGCIYLDLYFAEGREQRAQGLMFIRELGAFEGMMFDSGQPEEISMWMKNTYIPLDMVFLTGDGHIAGIAADTKPLSEDLIRSPGAINAVLELNGGFARRYGLRTGDRLILVP